MEVRCDSTGIQTVIIRTQSAGVLTEKEPEVERAEVMMQTEVEEPTAMSDVDTQTTSANLSNIYIQTENTATINTSAQTDQVSMIHSEVQTEEVRSLAKIAKNSSVLPCLTPQGLVSNNKFSFCVSIHFL